MLREIRRKKEKYSRSHWNMKSEVIAIEAENTIMRDTVNKMDCGDRKRICWSKDTNNETGSLVWED